MTHTPHWSQSHVEKLMDISTALADYTQSPEPSVKITAFLTGALDIEPLTLAIIEEAGDGVAKILHTGSSGSVARDDNGDVEPHFGEQLLEIYRQSLPNTRRDPAPFRLAGATQDTDADFYDIEISTLAFFPRAMVFARTIDATHRMCLIVHQRPDQQVPSQAVVHLLVMIAGQLAKLLRCSLACAHDPGALGVPFDRLTGREWMVLQNLNSEDGEKQLADRLNLSAHTLHSHIKSIYRKVGVQGRLPLLLRLQEAQRDLRTASINAHAGTNGSERAQNVMAIG